MDKIWANRLISGSKLFSEVPESRKESVKAELQNRVRLGEITEERYQEIISH